MLWMPRKWPRNLLFYFTILHICTFSLIYTVSLDTMSLRLRLLVFTCNKCVNLIILRSFIVILMGNLHFLFIYRSFDLNLSIILFSLHINDRRPFFHSHCTLLSLLSLDKLQLSSSIFLSLELTTRTRVGFIGTKLSLRTNTLPLLPWSIPTQHSFQLLVGSCIVPDNLLFFYLWDQ